MLRAHLFCERGFNLIELVVVMAIIAILATLAIPSQTGRLTQQKIIETYDLVLPYKGSIEAYYRLHAGKFPSNNDEANMPEPRKILGNYLEKTEVRDGVLHLWLGQKLPDKLHNKILSLRPVFVKDSPNSPVSWICGYNNVPQGMTASGINLTDIKPIYLPGRCR